MSNLLEQTEVTTKSKRLERLSGKLPSKLRLTSATKISLTNNINKKLLEKAFMKINTQYGELINAALIAEKTKAEEEARRTLSGNGDLEKRIEEDEIISSITSADVVVPRTKKLKVETLKLEGNIGTYKDNFGINVKKGFALKPPKALSVQKRMADIFRNILVKHDLYKIAAKKGVVAKEGEITEAEANVPSWRKLFSNVSSTPANITVAMNKPKDEEEKEEIVIPSSKKLSEEDLSYRKMLGQLGDEFDLIESYEKSTNGVPSQFKEGFESRKNNLSKIFFDLTGIDSQNRKKIDYSLRDNTEFQNLIDEVNGYKEPLSEEEHKKMEDSLNEYYNREDVSSKISELNEKDVLFTFNQHMDDVIKAESLQNAQQAEVSVAKSEVETAVSEEKLESDRVLEELKRGADEQARMLKTLYDYMDARDEFEKVKAEEERRQKQEILESAEVEARRLHENNLILEGAEEQAKILFNSNKEELEKESMNKMIQESAKSEAQRIVNDELKAKEEENLQEMIKESAKVEAGRIQEVNIIAEGAETQARELYEKNIIAEGAEEQAKLLHEKEINEEKAILLEGAKAQAELLNDKNLIIDGIEEQARELQRNNEYADILESAEVQAKILAKKDKKTQLLEEARTLSEKLKSINEEASTIDDSIAKYVDQDRLNDFGPVSDKKEKVEEKKSEIVKMEDAFFDPEIIDSAEKEAERLNQLNIIAESAEKEAERLYQNNVIADSAEKEAERLHVLNQIADSAEIEARRLHESNMIADSAVVEAKRMISQEVENNTATQVAPTPVATATTTVDSNKDYEIIDNTDRYAELTGKSNALLVTSARIDNINKRVNVNEKDPINKKKEILTTLKEELETGNYSFLQRSENIDEMVPNVKAA